MSNYWSNLWQSTLGYGATGERYAYLTEEQNARLERIRVSRMLWKGQHRRAFLDEGRSQFNFPEMKVQGRTILPYVPFNVLRLISTTLTDLLLGAEPMLGIDDAALQASLGDLVKRSDLHRVFYDAARAASWAGEAMVEICRFDGQAYVCDVKADEIFPIGRRNPDGQFAQYRRFAVETIRDERGEKKLLLETTYKAGSIERQCFELDGTTKKQDVSLALWPVKRADGLDLPPIEATGIAWNTIVWMANELDEGNPTSDYDGLIELQDELNHKQTQIARVIAKHADPKIAMPAGFAANVDGNVPHSHDVFYFNNKEEIPSYITWNAELAHAIEDRDFTLNALCIAAELSQVLLGIKQGATPDAARKLRLEATKSLARKDRKASFARPFIRQAVDTALAMSETRKVVRFAMPTALPRPEGTGGLAKDGSAITLRDGLPSDEIDEFTALNLATGGKAFMAVETAVERINPDPEAVAKEMKRLAADREAAMPTILTGGFGAREPGEMNDTPTGAEPQEQPE